MCAENKITTTMTQPNNNNTDCVIYGYLSVLNTCFVSIIYRLLVKDVFQWRKMVDY
jgi:hypothetical protein